MNYENERNCIICTRSDMAAGAGPAIQARFKIVTISDTITRVLLISSQKSIIIGDILFITYFLFSTDRLDRSGHPIGHTYTCYIEEIDRE